MKAVVVLSGGQDSATCLALAIRRYGAEEVAAITFAYGQRHSVEVKYAKHLVRRIPQVLGATSGRTIPVLHKIVHLDFYKDLTSNALLDPTMKISRRSEVKNGMSLDPLSNSNSKLQLNPPNTVVEGRNAVFLQLASVWAKTLGATVVYTGVSEADFSGYPDCREGFIKAQGKAIRLALDYPIRIVTPFMHMTKAEEWALAGELGILDVIRNETVTCYNGIPGKGCGKCPACKLRNRGLREYERSL